VFDQPNLHALATYVSTEIDILHQQREGDAPPVEGYLEASNKKIRHKISAPVAPTRRNPSCVFLLSAPRSGSTLLRVMLSAHPELFSPPELHILHFQSMDDRRVILGDGNYLGDGLQRALMEVKDIDAAASEAFIDEMTEKCTPMQDVYTILQEGAGPRILVDKSPTYSGNRVTLQRAEALFDRPRYLYLYRHPYACIESYVRNRTGRMFDFGHADPYLLAEEVWATHNDNVARFFKQIDEERRYAIRYEELVSDPKTIMGGICEFIEVPFCEAVLDPYSEGRMIDGVRATGRAIGDPNFLKHDKIEGDLAEAWKCVKLPRPLGEFAQRVAGHLQYELPVEQTGAISSKSGQSSDEFEEERL